MTTTTYSTRHQTTKPFTFTEMVGGVPHKTGHSDGLLVFVWHVGTHGWLCGVGAGKLLLMKV